MYVWVYYVFIYNTANTASTSINEVGTTLYAYKYDKCSCGRNSDCPLMTVCMSTSLLY